MDDKSIEELKIYIQAQQTTILQLSRKLQLIEDERNHLKTMLDVSMPVLLTTDQTEPTEDQICKLEIQKLRNISLQRELLSDEAKRLDIYVRILRDGAKKDKRNEQEAKCLNDDDLLRLIENKE